MSSKDSVQRSAKIATDLFPNPNSAIGHLGWAEAFKGADHSLSGSPDSPAEYKGAEPGSAEEDLNATCNAVRRATKHMVFYAITGMTDPPQEEI